MDAFPSRPPRSRPRVRWSRSNVPDAAARRDPQQACGSVDEGSDASGKLAEVTVGRGWAGYASSGDLRVTTYKGKQRVELIARWADFFGKCR